MVHGIASPSETDEEADIAANENFSWLSINEVWRYIDDGHVKDIEAEDINPVLPSPVVDQPGPMNDNGFVTSKTSVHSQVASIVEPSKVTGDEDTVTLLSFDNPAGEPLDLSLSFVPPDSESVAPVIQARASRLSKVRAKFCWKKAEKAGGGGRVKKTLKRAIKGLGALNPFPMAE